MTSDAPENFFNRWARRKAESEQTTAVDRHALPVGSPHSDAALPAVQALTTAPTLADVGLLARDADFSCYLANGLDPAVRRAAMKKLFSDPHFNCMDGLDIYIDDYTKASPVSATMLAGLAHARSTLNPRPAWITDKTEDDPRADIDAASTDGCNPSAVSISPASETEVDHSFSDQHVECDLDAGAENTAADCATCAVRNETLAPAPLEFVTAEPTGKATLNSVHDH